MRFLYLDDSGKIHPNDPTRVVVFGGFSIDEAQWHSLVRQINGAKSNFYPKRGTPIGNPHSWEVKSSDYLTHNAWNRKKTRQFCMELGNILRRNQGSVYAVALEKRLAKPPLDESTYVPLAFQRLVVKFMEELAYCNTTGTVVCDWSTHRLDRHIANCVQSMVAARGLQRTSVAARRRHLRGLASAGAVAGGGPDCSNVSHHARGVTPLARVRNSSARLGLSPRRGPGLHGVSRRQCVSPVLASGGCVTSRID